MDGLLANGGGDHEYKPLHDGPLPWPQRIKALPSVLFLRIRRGGLGLILRIAAIFFGMLLLYSLFTPDLSERYLNGLSWTKKRPTNGRNLRIVVFGSQDVMGSSADVASTRATWPEQLCKELDCDSLVSFVPSEGSAPALTSNEIYGTELHSLQQIAEQADILEKPSADYFYISEQYPVPSKTPDLEAQIEQFLSSTPPDARPHETLWVFTFGTWDIWNLAAMPIASTESIIDNLTSHLFSHVERLYLEALNPDSMAYSDFWNNSTRAQVDELADKNKPKDFDPRRLESFRLLIPELFDISLTPGWQTRPEPSMPYTDAQQVRNSAVLTQRWNSRVRQLVEDWNKKGSAQPEAVDGQPVQPPPIHVPQAASTLHRASSLSEDAESQTSDGGIVYVPYPRRAGLLSKTATTIVGAMTEEEMQRTGAKDSNGRGTMASDDKMRFLDVWNPCVPSKVNVPEIDEEDVTTCKAPNEHLFRDGFTVTQRAANELAKKSAGDVTKYILKRD